MNPPNIILVPSQRPHPQPARFDRVEVLGVSIGVLTRHRLTALLRECLDAGMRGWFSYVNVYAVNLAFEHAWFRLFLNESLVTYCDGQGVRLGAALLGRPLPERIVMSDWIYDVCELAVMRQARVYLLGSTLQVIEKACAVLREMYPELRIVGTHHGYPSEIECELVVQSIQKANPDLLIVGMGMPHQEEWILRYRDRLNAQIVLNAGSCFDYVAGAKKRCPAWMGVMGLEWLFRLVKEPRRLWRRYVIGNPLFLLRILHERLRFLFPR